jgi:hypothetical protein
MFMWVFYCQNKHVYDWRVKPLDTRKKEWEITAQAVKNHSPR